MSDTNKNDALNAPNIITAARFLLSIVIFILLPLQQYTLSLILFIIAAGTDWVDGYLARKYDQVTQLGRILDPFCDKIIICGTFTLLAVEMARLQASGKFIPDDAFYVIQGWMAVVVVGREILVTALRGFIEQHGGDFSANMPGKLKMVFQCGAVIGALLIIGKSEDPENATQISYALSYSTAAFVWLAVISTVYSGLIYIKASIELIPKLTKPQDVEAE